MPGDNPQYVFYPWHRVMLLARAAGTGHAESIRAREDGEHIYTAKELAQLLDFTLDHVRHMLQVGDP